MPSTHSPRPAFDWEDRATWAPVLLDAVHRGAIALPVDPDAADAAATGVWHA